MSIKKLKNFSLEVILENIGDFVNKYITQIIFASSLVLLIIFLMIFIHNRKIEKKQNLMIDYYKSLSYIQNGEINQAQNVLELVYDSKYSNEEIKTLSGIKLAEILAKKNDISKAVKLYEEIYNFKKNDLFFRNLSGLAAVNLLLNENNSNDYEKIKKIIGTLKNNSNPILYLVKEQEGIFYIISGNKKEGISLLENLLQENIDSDTKNRIETILGIYKNENI